MRQDSLRSLRWRSIVVLLVAWFATPSWATGAATVRVQGEVQKPQEWTAGQLRRTRSSDVHLIHYASRGQQHTSNAIELLALLKAAEAPIEFKMDPNADPKRKNYPLRLSVMVAGHDGYTVAFALAELLPDIGNREVWLAFDADGHPFPDGDGHLRLIVPGDQKPGRWVRDVTSITVVDGGSGAKQERR